MNHILDACLRSWPWDPWLTGTLVLSAAIYGRGWRMLRRRDAERWTSSRFAAFLGGLTAIFVALGSPIEPFSSFFLQVHMLQHLLLMMVAPPLIWLGAPFLPMLRGLPREVRSVWIGPLLRSSALRRLFERITHPLVAWVIYVGTTWLWHVPRFYDAALRSSGWHYVQHACFIGSSLLFWYPVIRPYPSRPKWSLWWLVPFLILADVQNTVLSALLSFSSRVIYPYYDEIPRLGNISALDDQATAGVLMWVPGSVAFLAPLFWIGLRLLFGAPAARPAARLLAPRRTSLPLVNDAPRNDLLRWPLVSRFLRWRHARLCLQIPLLILAAVVIVDGLAGPQAAPLNLAGVLPWIHWRGLLIFGLLVAGNVFCMACPFMAPRTLARKLWSPTRSWPRWLRNKYLAIALLVAFFWAYEAFSLWDNPWLTAWIALAYFAAPLFVDGFFRGASFCKFVCPIGQFNFVQSLISPLEIKVRDPRICETCATKDCIRGPSGCELRLFQPRKSSNMDCTFCLDCVHACPHDNIALTATLPASELLHDPQRSGIGRFSRRRDLAALVWLTIFGAFVNAALMTGPVVAFTNRLAGEIGGILAVTCVFATTLIAIPATLLAVVGLASRRLGRIAAPWWEVVVRYAYPTVPIGFAMWLAHYSFHFLTSCSTALPATQRFLADHGLTTLGEPEWSSSCCTPPAAWLLKFEIVCLDLGLLLALYVSYRVSRSLAPRPFAAFVPWAMALLLLFATGVWIVFQPMEMRGAMPG